MPGMLSGNDMLGCHALIKAISTLDGRTLHDALGKIITEMLGGASGIYVLKQPNDPAFDVHALVYNDHNYGYFCLPQASVHTPDADRRIAAAMELTAYMLHLQETYQRRSRALIDLELELEQKHQILDQMSESVITVDKEGFITSWNHGAEKMFGYQSAEVLGRNIIFLYEGEDDAMQDDMIDWRSEREMEIRRRKKTGEIFWASMSWSLLHGHLGQVIGMIGYLTDITERKIAQERIHQLAFYDTLTGLPNRAMLLRKIEQMIKAAHDKSEWGCVLYLDLNRFKPISNTLGHDVGDAIIIQIAMRLKHILREEDIVARVGEDEFAIAMFGIDKDYHPGFVAQKIIASFDEPYNVGDHELRIGVHAGISMYPQDAADHETLLRLSDIAMFRAKQKRDNESGYAYYSEEMNRQSLNQLRVEIDLLRAIENNELILHYQPKVHLQDGVITGAEALVRWYHPDRGLLQPEEFIAIAEESGLIVPLSEWVLEAACRQAGIWKGQGLAPVRIAINITAVEFTRALPVRISTILERYHLTGEWLELEVTEGMLMQSTDNVINIMEKICQQGVTIALDDFGTGYSSLSYLKRFPIHSLKIDRSFTMGIPDDPNDCTIASAIIGIAKQLKHKVVAEGVENLAQLSFLKEAGCDEIQGYLFSKPGGPDVFKDMLVERHSLNAMVY
jgi:diguanylate cyclase (GGDEF)-like protein/PAS domain S-box-containing protein